MEISTVVGKCGKTSKTIGIQFIKDGNRFRAGGSFKPASAMEDRAELGLSGEFFIAQGFRCHFCRRTALFQCGKCKQFVCYDGKAASLECPNCGAQNGVIALPPDLRIPRGSVGAALDIVLAIDVSKSMSGQRLASVKEGAVDYIDRFVGKSRIALVTFGNYSGDKVKVETPLTEDFPRLKSLVTGLSAHAATPSPLDCVLSHPSLESFRNSENRRYLVIFTDGGWDGSEGVHVANADRLLAMGIKVITIGCAQANVAFLKKISSPNASIIVSDDGIGGGFAEAATATGQ